MYVLGHTLGEFFTSSIWSPWFSETKKKQKFLRNSFSLKQTKSLEKKWIKISTETAPASKQWRTKETFCQNWSTTGLPDGLFSNQKSQIWVNFRGPLNSKCWYIL
jgi:hypothetical protein